jgi:hypothetical protein
VNKNPRNPGAAYLPERYKQQIVAKKRRRLIKKVAVICGAITIAVLVYIVLIGALVSPLNQYQHPLPASAEPSPVTFPVSPSTVPLTSLTRDMTTAINPAIIVGTGIPLQSVSGGILSLNDAIASIRQDYPEPLYTLVSVNLTNQYTNSTLYEFRIRKPDSPSGDPGFPVLIDASTGDPYIQGQESARISAVQAKNLVQDAFLIPGPDSIRIRYDRSPDSARAWIFTVQQDNITRITGSLDPDTGQIISFSRAVSQQGRQANPVLDISAAQKIADRSIIDRNGVPLPVNMSEARYDPLGLPNESVAGQYVFVYNRIVQDIPCDYDGFTISVDSVTGDVMEYNRRWNSPDNAFSVAVDPLVKRYEAILLVQKRARETFPASASSLKIISTEIRWKDMYTPGSIPRPGSISIAWKVQFDDESIRAKQWPVPAIGWVDARTGKILDLYYQH